MTTEGGGDEEGDGNAVNSIFLLPVRDANNAFYIARRKEFRFFSFL